MIVKLRYFKPYQPKRWAAAGGKPHKKATLKQRVKANMRYITHRSGKDGEKMSRDLFGPDGKLEKEQIYTMIDQAPKGTNFHKLVISPSPKRNDQEDWDKTLNLRQLTLETIAEFEETIGQRVQFFAAIHADHRPHRHVHATVLVTGRLSREVFNALPGNLLQAATDEALFQRQQIDQSLGYEPRIHKQGRVPYRQPLRGGYSGRPAKSHYALSDTCPVCSQTSPWHEAWCPWGHQMEWEVGLQL